MWLLRTLNAETLNSKPTRSVTLKFFRTDKSHSWNPGPIRAPGPHVAERSQGRGNNH